MATIDFGAGEQEFRCTARTLTIYEQAFCADPNPRVTGDLIADVLGKQRITDESLGFKLGDDGTISEIILDFTGDNWNAERRALWAMLKTQWEIDRKHGRDGKPVPSYREWDESLLESDMDMRAVSNAVGEELNRGLFRSGAAASGQTSEER